MKESEESGALGFYLLLFAMIAFMSVVTTAKVVSKEAKSYACEHRCNELGYTGSELDDGCWCTEGDRKKKVNYTLESW